eukprot:781371-Prymnesium_polylepis.1
MGDDDGAPPDGGAQLVQHLLVDGGGTLEGEREDGLRDERREALAHQRAREGEQRDRHDLHHQLAAVGEEEGEQRQDRARLARAHDHLRDERAAR